MDLCKVTGVRDVVKRLMTVRGSTASGMERGYVKAGLFLLRESQKIVPVDTGALKNSGFVRKDGAGFKTKVIVGYTQNYAIYVHENVEAAHAKGKSAKFLEIPARRFREQILKIIKTEAIK